LTQTQGPYHIIYEPNVVFEAVRDSSQAHHSPQLLNNQRYVG